MEIFHENQSLSKLEKENARIMGFLSKKIIQINLLSFVFCLWSSIAFSETIDLVSHTTAPQGDYHAVISNSANIYNVLSNPDPALADPSGANFSNDFRYVNINRGLRILGDPMASDINANTYEFQNKPYIKLDAVTSEIFLSENSKIRVLDNNHGIWFDTQNNIMEFRGWDDIVFSSHMVLTQDYMAIGTVDLPGSLAANFSAYNGGYEALHFYEPNTNTEVYTLFQNDKSGDGAADGFLMGLTSNNKVLLWNFEDTNIYLKTAGQTRMVITNDVDNDTKVGIGDDDPQHTLTLAGNDDSMKLAVYQASSGIDFYGFGKSGDNLTIHAGSAPGAFPGMVIKNTTGVPQIGIGQYFEPETMLHLRKYNSNSILAVYASQPYILLRTTGNLDAKMGLTAQNDMYLGTVSDRDLYFKVAGASRFKIANDGNVIFNANSYLRGAFYQMEHRSYTVHYCNESCYVEDGAIMWSSSWVWQGGWVYDGSVGCYDCLDYYNQGWPIPSDVNQQPFNPVHICDKCGNVLSDLNSRSHICSETGENIDNAAVLLRGFKLHVNKDRSLRTMSCWVDHSVSNSQVNYTVLAQATDDDSNYIEHGEMLYTILMW